MCRRLAADDTEVRAGRKTRCFNPDRETKRKQCLTLVPHYFRTVVSPSFYLPSELQRQNVEYSCINPNQLIMDEFEGQGQNFTIQHAADHIIVGPMLGNGRWGVRCVDPSALVPHGAPVIGEGETLNFRDTKRAMQITGFVPTQEDCQLILDRWQNERRWICNLGRENLNTGMAFVRSLRAHNLCSDDLFEPVSEIVEALTTRDATSNFKRMVGHLFSMGMYMRRWAGEGTPYPWLEADTHILVTLVSQSLRGQVDPDSRLPLDYISTNSADGTAGLLVNLVRMHGRLFLSYLEDNVLDQNTISALRNIQVASISTRSLVPRHKKPTRYVHQLLPIDGETLVSVVNRCMLGQMCIRMGSSRLITTATMLFYAAFSSASGAPWSDEDIANLEQLDNII